MIERKRECQIFHVKQGGRQGWRWRAVAPDGSVKVSAEIHELFYECVTAARASGYSPVPALRCA